MIWARCRTGSAQAEAVAAGGGGRADGGTEMDSDGEQQGTRTSKAPDAFRTISEVSEELDLPQHVLRFWETRFTQIKPMKRRGGRRFYRPEDIRILRGIKSLLHVEGYTIKGVQKLLKDQGVKALPFAGEEWVATPSPTGPSPMGSSSPEPADDRTEMEDPSRTDARAVPVSPDSATLQDAVKDLKQIRDLLRQHG